MASEEYTEQGLPKLHKTQRRWVLGVFVLFALLALLLGVFALADGFFGDTIRERKEAYKRLEEKGLDVNLLLSQNEKERALLLHEKRTDTDSDGVSDYDEKYVYGSSIYLTDSDSDGIPDYDEIISGQNPKCHEGREDCFGEMKEGEGTARTGSNVASDEMTQMKLLQDYFKENLSETEATNLTALEFKRALIGAGFDTKAVSALSAQQLEGLKTQLFTQDYKLNSNIETDLTHLDLLALSPEEMRDLLQKMGVPQDVLSLLSDKELFDLYVSTLSELSNVQAEDLIITGESPTPANEPDL